MKFRASFTTLSLWAQGNIPEAVQCYFKMDRIITRQMEEGKDYHTAWQKEIDTTKCLPEVFGKTPLKDPKTELKLVWEAEDWLDIVGMLDCLDCPVVHEFKTGKKSSSEYTEEYQLAVYGVLANKCGYPVSKGHLHHYNQYTKKVDFGMVYLTDSYMADGLNWMVSLAGEMHQYLEDGGYYERYTKKEVV